MGIAAEASEAVEHRPRERVGMAVEHRRTQPQGVHDEGLGRELQAAVDDIYLMDVSKMVSQMLHVWNIYLHLPSFTLNMTRIFGRQIYANIFH